MAGTDKENLAKSLASNTSRPAIRRGQGIRLSTDQPATPELPVDVPSANQEIEKSGKEERTKQKVKRVKPGYELREDLVKACKRIAFEEERHNYEIVEEALEQYLARRAAGSQQGAKPDGEGETANVSSP